MGFIKEDKYGLEVYLTNEGLNKLYGSGTLDSALQNVVGAVKYFTLGSSGGDYSKYIDATDDSELKFIIDKGDIQNGYYVNPHDPSIPITIVDNKQIGLSGRNSNNNVTKGMMFKSSQYKMDDIIFYAPDKTGQYNAVNYKSQEE